MFVSSQVAERGAQRIADRLAALVENGLDHPGEQHLVATESLYPVARQPCIQHAFRRYLS